jgi:hypothetical protein
VEVAVSYSTTFFFFPDYVLTDCDSEEEDENDYAFPLTLRQKKKPAGGNSPAEGILNGNSTAA